MKSSQGGVIKALCRLTVSVVVLTMAAVATAAPMNPFPFNVSQPDGTEITIQMHGDDFLNWKTTQDGYAIVKSSDGYYYYAGLGEDDRLVATQYKAGIDDPATAGLIKGVMPGTTQADKVRKSFDQLMTTKAPNNGSVDQPGSVLHNLVVLVSFNDHYDSRNKTVSEQYGKTAAEYDVVFNHNTLDMGPASAELLRGGSVRDFWNYNTYGKYIIESDVLDYWVKLPEDEAYYYHVQEYNELEELRHSPQRAFNKIIEHAWPRILGQINAGEIEIDLSKYDYMTVIHSGWGGEYGVENTLDSTSVLLGISGVTFSSACMAPALSTKILPKAPNAAGPDVNAIVEIGVIVNEMGSSLLYLPNADYFNSSGVYSYYVNDYSQWCVMNKGCWGFDGDPAFPTQLSAPVKYVAGYIKPTVINLESDSTAEVDGRRYIGDQYTFRGRIAPDSLTMDGWGNYEVHASSVDQDSYYLVDMEPQKLTIRQPVNDIDDIDSVPGLIADYLHTIADKARGLYYIPDDSIFFNGGQSGRGFFRGGLKAGLDFDAGMIFSTGNVNSASGPNDNTNKSTNNGDDSKNSISGMTEMLHPMEVDKQDPAKVSLVRKLDYLAGGLNAAGIEFDLHRRVTKIDFSFLMGTETPEDNDTMAIIVDGKVGWLVTPDNNCDGKPDIEYNQYAVAPILMRYEMDPNKYMPDMDDDGFHDGFDTDADGDMILDSFGELVGGVYLDPNGNELPGEDANGNGWLDEGEDINEDGLLTINEDKNGNGEFDEGEDVNGNDVFDQGDPEVVWSDLDRDGKVDALELDADGDLILDRPGKLVGGVYYDYEGNKLVNEDVNHNGRLDYKEDLNGDGLLYINEDTNGNGQLDAGEDVYGNGKLDLAEKDTNKNGQPDPDEDINGNGQLDPTEDTNGNGKLDAGEDKNGLLDVGDLVIAWYDLDSDGTHDNADPDANGNLIRDYFGVLIDGVYYDRNGKELPNEDKSGNADPSDPNNVDINKDGLLNINEDLNGDGELSGTDPDVPATFEDFKGNKKLDIGDPNEGDFVDKDEDGINDVIDSEIVSKSPNSFVPIVIHDTMNSTFDNSRAVQSSKYRKEGQEPYSIEFEKFTNRIYLTLDLNDLKPLFWEMPEMTVDKPTDSEGGIIRWLDIDGNGKLDGYEHIEGVDQAQIDWTERFNAFLNQDYHNIKIIVFDMSKDGTTKTGDTAAFIEYGSLFSWVPKGMTSYFPYSEYLLIENRQRTRPFPNWHVSVIEESDEPNVPGSGGGEVVDIYDSNDYEGFDFQMPSKGGLAIWHMESSGYGITGYSGLDGYPANGTHLRAALVQPDNSWDIERFGDADAGDLYSAPNYNQFTPNTSPNTNVYRYGCVADSGITISHISKADNYMSFVVTEADVYNDNISRPLSINDFAEFSNKQGENWWIGSGNYDLEQFWKYTPAAMEGATGMDIPSMPVNHPRNNPEYVPYQYRIYGDTTNADVAWIPDPYDPYRWEHGSPCSGYDLTDTYDARGDGKKPIDSKVLWYTMTAEKTGFVHISTCSSGFDTTITVYSSPEDVLNNDKNILTKNFLECNDDSEVSESECYYSSAVDVYMEAGLEYLIRVGGYNYESGDFNLHINYRDTAENDEHTGAVALVVNTPVVGDITDASGTDITPELTYEGDPNNGDSLDLWYKFTPEHTTDYRISVCTNEFDPTLSVFFIEGEEMILEQYNDNMADSPELRHLECSAYSSHLSMDMEAGETYYIRVAGAPRSHGKFSIEIANRPINDDMSGAIEATDNAVTGKVYTGNTQYATVSLDAQKKAITTTCNDSASGGNYDVWYSYKPKYSGSVTMSLKGSLFDTVLALFDADGGYLACNDDSKFYSQWSQQSVLTCDMVAGKKYYIRISGWGNNVGAYTLKITGGGGDSYSLLEIVSPDSKMLVDATNVGSPAYKPGQSVDMIITARGGHPSPITGYYTNWMINIPDSGQGYNNSKPSVFTEPVSNHRLGISANDELRNYTLPFDFPFFGTNYTNVRISTNGFIKFGNASDSLPFNSEAGLRDNIMIAPMWDDYKLNGSTFDVYVDKSVAGKVVIIWVAEYVGDVSAAGDKCEFSATLYASGGIRFDYGQMSRGGNELLTTPTVGVSSGTGEYYYVKGYSYDANNTSTDDNVMRGLSQANALTFNNPGTDDLLPSGLTYTKLNDGIHITGTIDKEYPVREDGSANFIIEVSVSDYDNPSAIAKKQIGLYMVDSLDGLLEDTIARNWLAGDCASNNWCDNSDLNGDGKVDLKDFAIYALFATKYNLF